MGRGCKGLLDGLAKGDYRNLAVPRAVTRNVLTFMLTAKSYPQS